VLLRFPEEPLLHGRVPAPPGAATVRERLARLLSGESRVSVQPSNLPLDTSPKDALERGEIGCGHLTLGNEVEIPLRHPQKDMLSAFRDPFDESPTDPAAGVHTFREDAPSRECILRQPTEAWFLSAAWFECTNAQEQASAEEDRGKDNRKSGRCISAVQPKQ